MRSEWEACPENGDIIMSGELVSATAGVDVLEVGCGVVTCGACPRSFAPKGKNQNLHKL